MSANLGPIDKAEEEWRKMIVMIVDISLRTSHMHAHMCAHIRKHTSMHMPTHIRLGKEGALRLRTYTGL